MWTSIGSGSVRAHATSALRTEHDTQLLLSLLGSMIIPFTNGASKRFNATEEVLRLPTATVSYNDTYSAAPTDVGNLTELYGPTRDPLYVVIPITIVYLLIFISGVIGNISTCIVIARNRSMHTATNYYLFSLAVSDFLLLVSGVPQEIYFIWSKYPYVFGETFCVLRGIAAETSANATVLTITAFTVERYVAICHPFLSHTMSKLSRAIRFIFVIWLIAIASAIPQALQFGVTSQGGIDQCVVKRIIIQHSFELSTFLFFFAPMTLITVLYALIGLKLRSSTLMQRDGTLQRRNNVATNSHQSSANSKGTRRVLKMLVAVVVAFFICWAPFHAQRLVYIYGVDKDHQPSDPLILQLFVITTYISGILYYMSTCINPLLYNIMSNKFRQAFKETLANCCQIARESNSTDRSYRILPRRERPSAANKESSDVSGNSIPDESLYSSSTQKQSFDSLTLSRGHSLKRPPSSAGAFAGPESSVLSASVALATFCNHSHHLQHHHFHQHNNHHHHHHQHSQQHHDGTAKRSGRGGGNAKMTMVAGGVEGSRASVVEDAKMVFCAYRQGRSELDHYTQERELQLNIFSSVEVSGTGPGGGDSGAEQQQLSRISIQVNQLRQESRLPAPDSFLGGIQLRHTGMWGGDSKRLLFKQPRGHNDRLDILVHGRQRHRGICLFRFFQQVRRLRWGGAADRQDTHDGGGTTGQLLSPEESTVVHFFGSVRMLDELQGEAILSFRTKTTEEVFEGTVEKEPALPVATVGADSDTIHTVL